MKKLLILTFYFVVNSIQSQKYQITYDFQQIAKTINLKSEVKTYLEGNGLVSRYEEL